MDEGLKQLIHVNAPVVEIKKMAQAEGLKTLRQSGLDLVRRGLTTVEEVFRNTVG